MIHSETLLCIVFKGRSGFQCQGQSFGVTDGVGAKLVLKLFCLFLFLFSNKINNNSIKKTDCVTVALYRLFHILKLGFMMQLRQVLQTTK